MNVIVTTAVVGLAMIMVPVAPQRNAGRPDFSGHWIVDVPADAAAETVLPSFCVRECTIVHATQTLTVETGGRKTTYTLNGIPVRQDMTSPYGISVTTTMAAWEGTTLVITFTVESSGDRPLPPNVTRLSLARGRLHIENVRPAMGRGLSSHADYTRARP